MNTDKDFKTLFNELLHSYGMGISKLADATAIPERYLEAMRAGNDSILPPEPYIRGYLVKIIALTGGNLEELMVAYKKEAQQKTSGSSDRLPSNRFTLQKLSKSKVSLAVLVILLLIYGFLRIDTIIGKPKLIVKEPTEQVVFTSLSTISIEGEVSQGDKITVNGENVIVQENGNFSITWPLTSGVNNLEIKAKRFLGKEEIVTKKVVFTEEGGPGATGTSTESLP